MNETAFEEEARHIKLLEQRQQNFMDTHALWEQRKTDNYPDAERMLALLDRDLEMNAELLEQAKERLAQLSADTD